MKSLNRYISESNDNLAKDLETEELPNGYTIVYKHNIIEKISGNVRGLKLKKYYYAELYKGKERVDWTYADADAKAIFDEKIKEWKLK